MVDTLRKILEVAKEASAQFSGCRVRKSTEVEQVIERLVDANMSYENKMMAFEEECDERQLKITDENRVYADAMFSL